MPTVTLLVKAKNRFYLKHVDRFLKVKLGDLRVKTETCGVASRGWVQVVVSGEDEAVALRYLADEVGLCPARLESVEKFSTIRGQIVNMDKSKDKLNIDIGVFSPDIVDASIPIQRLQAQLTDGRKVAFKKIVELFGFCENLPLTMKISDIDEGNLSVEAIFSEKQLDQYKKWAKSLLERLIVMGTTFQEVLTALRTTGISRDVVKIESLGLFEHAMVCKLGTDAAGLISKTGKTLRNATFSIFNPEEVLGFLGDYFIA
jgi:hypothetical protein